MGCGNSRPRTSDPLLDTSRSNDSRRRIQRASTMGIPSYNPQYSSMGPVPLPVPSSSRLAAQHERLILELLPFKESREFQEWLAGPYIVGAWADFYHSCKSGEANGQASSSASEPDKQKVAQAAKNAIDRKSPKYLVYHPQKEDWTVEDHWVRFVAVVVTDNMMDKMWSDSDWKKRGLDITSAVYEVLCFLRSTVGGEEHTGMSSEPPRYED